MKVEAIKNFSTGKNYNFGTREKSHEGVRAEGRTDSSMLTKVPVIVMLAMNPATLNSAIPMSPDFDNPNQIVMLAPQVKKDELSYTTFQEAQQSKHPYGWGYLSYGKIQHIISTKVNNYKDMDIVFFTPTRKGGIDNEVSEIFLIDKNLKGCKRVVPHPPRVKKIIYHDIGKDKEYCSVYTEGFLANDEGEAIGYIHQELKIDDDTANKLMALTLNKTEWKNETNIEFETTTDTAIGKTRVNYFKN